MAVLLTLLVRLLGCVALLFQPGRSALCSFKSCESKPSYLVWPVLSLLANCSKDNEIVLKVEGRNINQELAVEVNVSYNCSSYNVTADQLVGHDVNTLFAFYSIWPIPPKTINAGNAGYHCTFGACSTMYDDSGFLNLQSCNRPFDTVMNHCFVGDPPEVSTAVLPLSSPSPDDTLTQLKSSTVGQWTSSGIILNSTTPVQTSSSPLLSISSSNSVTTPIASNTSFKLKAMDSTEISSQETKKSIPLSLSSTSYNSHHLSSVYTSTSSSAANEINNTQLPALSSSQWSMVPTTSAVTTTSIAMGGTLPPSEENITSVYYFVISSVVVVLLVLIITPSLCIFAIRRAKHGQKYSSGIEFDLPIAIKKGNQTMVAFQKPDITGSLVTIIQSLEVYNLSLPSTSSTSTNEEPNNSIPSDKADECCETPVEPVIDNEGTMDTSGSNVEHSNYDIRRNDMKHVSLSSIDGCGYVETSLEYPSHSCKQSTTDTSSPLHCPIRPPVIIETTAADDLRSVSLHSSFSDGYEQSTSEGYITEHERNDPDYIAEHTYLQTTTSCYNKDQQLTPVSVTVGQA